MGIVIPVTPDTILAPTVVEPMFTAFDIPVSSWHINLSNGSSREDTLSIVFDGTPLYLYNPILIGQVIKLQIEAEGFPKYILGVIRDINYIQPAGAARTKTTILLATQQVFFDTFFIGGHEITLGGENTSVVEVISGLAKALDIDITKVKNSVSVPIGLDGVRLTGRQNVLSWINQNTKGIKWWVDIFGQLNVFEDLPTEGNIKIDHGDYADLTLSVTSSLSKKYKDQESVTTHDYNLPTTPAKTKTVVRAKVPMNVKRTASGDLPKQGKIKVYNAKVNLTNVASDTPADIKSLEKMAVLAESMSITIKGTHWFVPHQLAYLSGWERGNGVWGLSGVSINRSPENITTTLSLERENRLFNASNTMRVET